MKFLDLFAGIGGFRLGMEQAGHECVGYVEWDKFARKSYEAIHNTEGEWTANDITTVTDEEIRSLGERNIDVICGGFPCQAFSVAGKRLGFEDTRGTMFFEIARFAKQIKPRFLFLENVKGLLSHEKGNTFGTILHTLDELGYDAEWQVLNSKNFGVPQNRERVFIIGHLRGSGGREVFPIGRTNEETGCNLVGMLDIKGKDQIRRVYGTDGISPTLTTMQGGGQEPKILDDQGRRNKQHTLKETVPTLRAQSHGNEPKEVIPVLTPGRAEKRQNGRRFKEDGEPMFTLTAQDKHGVLVSQKTGVRKTEIANCLDASYYKGLGNNQERMGVAIKEATKQGYDLAYPGDSINYSVPTSQTRRGRVGKEIANTLDTGCQQGVLTDEYRIRKLTPRECWRLQGYPDWTFDKAAEVNSDSQLYKQAGNSVTVNVIHEIAKRLGGNEE